MASATDDAVGSNGGEEGIKVAIRMRPLNTWEGGSSSGARVWKALQKHNSITQTSADGKPLPERVENRHFFTFDKVFGEKVSTADVYGQSAKPIVGSVMSGLNGTIFAYGQTSSGKTYTMQGAGTLGDWAVSSDGTNINGGGGGGDGGILHMAANDIFSHVASYPDRVFLIRVSFIEIYNEEVRDLLGSGRDDAADSQQNVLAIREDPRRGVFVNANESIVTDLPGLIGTLFAGEKNRHMASTGMNERSSRSHTIFRITVESRAKSEDGGVEADQEADADTNEENEETNTTNDGGKMSLKDGKDDGAVLVSTLNLVDLAGNESVRLTGATGDRQKEGGKINQSLLTLSRVIVALGRKDTHISFRDSKLTHILKPSLSGNALIAIICCATPSGQYLEETRSTLKFASQAKLVKTNARINEVLDDRSVIKRLQKELAEARRAACGKRALQQIKSLENEAAIAECEARRAEDKSRRLKNLILKGGMINASGSTQTSAQEDSDESGFGEREPKRRRRSDGILCGRVRATVRQVQPDDFSSPSATRGNQIPPLPRTTVKPAKDKEDAPPAGPTLEAELNLLRDALTAKGQQTRTLQAQLERTFESTKCQLSGAQVESTKSQLSGAQVELTKLVSEKEAALARATALEAEKEFIIIEKETAINDALTKVEQMLDEKQKLDETVKSLHSELEDLTKEKTAFEASPDEARTQMALTEAENQSFVAELQDRKVDLNEKLEQVSAEAEQYKGQTEELSGSVSALTEQVDALKEQTEQYKVSIESLQSEKITLEANIKELTNNSAESAKESREQVATLSGQVTTLSEENQELRAKIEEMKADASAAKEQAHGRVAELESSNVELNNLLESTTEAKDEATGRTEELDSTVSSMLEAATEASAHISELEDNIAKLQTDKASAEKESKATIEVLEGEKAAFCTKVEDAESRIAVFEAKVETLKTDMSTAEENSKTEIADLVDKLNESTSYAPMAEAALAILQNEMSAEGDIKQRVETLEEEKIELQNTLSSSKEEAAARIAELVSLIESLQTTMTASTEESMAQVESLEGEKAELVTKLQERETRASSAETEIEKRQEIQNELESSIKALESEKLGLQETIESLLSQSTEQVNALADEKNAAEAKLSEMTAQIEAVTIEKRTLEEQKSALAEEKESLSSKHKAAIEAMEAAVGTLEASVSEMQSQIKTLEYFLSFLLPSKRMQQRQKKTTAKTSSQNDQAQPPKIVPSNTEVKKNPTQAQKVLHSHMPAAPSTIAMQKPSEQQLGQKPEQESKARIESQPAAAQSKVATQKTTQKQARRQKCKKHLSDEAIDAPPRRKSSSRQRKTVSLYSEGSIADPSCSEALARHRQPDTSSDGEEEDNDKGRDMGTGKYVDQDMDMDMDKNKSKSEKKSDSGGTSPSQVAMRAKYPLGQPVIKTFPGQGTFEGKVTELPTHSHRYYHVVYEDKDEEDLSPNQIYKYVRRPAHPRLAKKPRILYSEGRHGS